MLGGLKVGMFKVGSLQSTNDEKINNKEKKGTKCIFPKAQLKNRLLSIIPQK